MDRICYNCCHYQQGQIENPCSKNPRYVGYLREGCRLWSEQERGIDENNATKRCVICGKVLPVKMFHQTKETKDGLTDACKDCKPRYWRIPKNSQLNKN